MEYNLGEALRRVRKSKGLTQEQLGDLAHIGASTVSKIERGESGPSIDTFRSLVLALDTSSDIILEIAKTNDAPSQELILQKMDELARSLDNHGEMFINYKYTAPAKDEP